MRIGASGLLAGMAVLLLAAVQAPVETQAPRGGAGQPEAQAEDTPQEITGDVLTASLTEVLVSVRGEPQLRLQLRPRTVVLVDGQMATPADIRDGSEVRAMYREVGGEPVAFLVEVSTRAHAPAAPSPESGESGPVER